MTKYRKRPVVIEAIQWTGYNTYEVIDFAGKNVATEKFDKDTDTLLVKTLEGTMKANIGDYIIKGIANEFYPCNEKIFYQTYEKVE